MKPIFPFEDNPITPAVTLDNTLSNNLLLRSVISLAVIKSSRWRFTCLVILLKTLLSMAISSSPASSITLTSKSPAPTRCAAPAKRPTGFDKRSANCIPNQIEDKITNVAKPKYNNP